MSALAKSRDFAARHKWAVAALVVANEIRGLIVVGTIGLQVMS